MKITESPRFYSPSPIKKKAKRSKLAGTTTKTIFKSEWIGTK